MYDMLVRNLIEYTPVTYFLHVSFLYCIYAQIDLFHKMMHKTYVHQITKLLNHIVLGKHFHSEEILIGIFFMHKETKKNSICLKTE